MNELELIQNYYSQLPDDQLIEFAKAEGTKISEDSLGILYDEFVKRDLDTRLLDAVIDKKARNNAAAAHTSSNWEYAFSEKKNGEPDEKILSELLNKGVDKNTAALIIQRLPNLQYQNEEFDNLISRKCENTSVWSLLATIVLFILAAYALYTGANGGNPLVMLLGAGIGIGGFFLIKKGSGDLKGGGYWINLIRTNPENIVWIKPIVVKHTAGYIITWYKEMQFQLLTKDDLKVTITCDQEQEREILFEGVKHLLPHVQIGYSQEVDALYSSDPENLISSLQARGIYTPMDTLPVPSSQPE